MKQLLLCSWAYVSCQYNTNVHFQLKNKKHAERRTLFENGEMAATLPTAALSPPFRALGVSLYARLLNQQTPHFPRVYFCFFSPFELHHCFPWQKIKKFRLNGGFEMNGGSKLYSHVCHAYWPWHWYQKYHACQSRHIGWHATGTKKYSTDCTFQWL